MPARKTSIPRFAATGAILGVLGMFGWIGASNYTAGTGVPAIIPAVVFGAPIGCVVGIAAAILASVVRGERSTQWLTAVGGLLASLMALTWTWWLGPQLSYGLRDYLTLQVGVPRTLQGPILLLVFALAGCALGAAAKKILDRRCPARQSGER